MKHLLKIIFLLLNAVGAVAVITLAIKFVGLPVYAKTALSESYKELMFQCDLAMREHMIAKNRFLLKPSMQSDQELKSAEVGLIACHDYDLLRKKMESFGVSSAELAVYGLEAMERNAEQVRQLVRTHEFRY